MKIQFKFKEKVFAADLAKPKSIAIPLRSGKKNPNCFWAPRPEFWPVRTDSFVGSRAGGGLLNFFNIKLNPHGNGTHTECVGHISEKPFVLRKCLKKSHFFAKLISIEPENQEDGEFVITKTQIHNALKPDQTEALIIRTKPNKKSKRKVDYSGTNPIFVHHAAMDYIVDCGIQHLLIDTPSVDREEDEGKLLAHKAFWQYPNAIRKACTITELIFVKNSIKDGYYLLNIQALKIDLDVSPSNPVLFDLVEL